VAARDTAFTFDKVIRESYGTDYSALGPQTKSAIYSAFQGNAVALASLPPSVQSVVADMRKVVDGNTETIAQQLDSAGNPSSKALAAELRKNKGQYANLSYRLFEKPQSQIDAVFSQKGAYKQVYADYYSFIEGRLVSALGRNPTQSEVRGTMRNVLESMSGESVLGKALSGQGITVSNGVNRPVGILKRRKAIPPELRAAMGQNLDTAVVFQLTVSKQAALIAAHDYQSRLLELGKGIWLHRTPTEEFTQPLVPEDKRNPLSGYYTTKEVAELILAGNTATTETVGAVGAALGVWRKLNAISRQAVTVGSTAAAGANYVGQPGFLLASGVWNPLKIARVYFPGKSQSQAALSDFPTVRRILDAKLGIGGKPSPAVAAEIAEYTRLGLLNDSVFSQDALDAARELGLDSQTLLDKGKLGKFVDSAMLPVKVARSLYNLSDTRARLIIFEDSFDQLKKAYPSRTDISALRKEAADIAKNVYPSYERAYGWAKDISRTGVVGPFAPFMAEVLRTTKNNLAYGLRDIDEGGRRWRAGEPGGKAQFLWGIRRYVGMSALLGGSVALTGALSGILGGLTDDEAERLDDSLPDYLRYTTAFYSRKADGTYQRYNLSRYIPALAYVDASRALLRDGVLAGGKAFTQPFLSEQLVTSRILNVKRNQTEDGRRVYNPEEQSSTKQASDIVKHIFEPIVPDIIRRPYSRIIPALSGATDKRGKPLDFEDEFMRAVGLTITTVDTRANLGFAAVKQQRANRDSITLFTNPLSNIGTPDATDIVDAYSRMETARLAVWKETYDRVISARGAGVSDSEIAKLLRAGGSKTREPTGLSGDVVRDIIAGIYRPYEFRDSEKYRQAVQLHRGSVPTESLLKIRKSFTGLRLDTPTKG
jgi:hypothetical protein